MRAGVGLWVVLGATAVSGPAGAWGSQGHQVVGSVADHFLGVNARAHVAQDLGYSLKVAATWPDCARAVSESDGFKYHSDPQYAEWCGVFETDEGKARMEDYVRRNAHDCVDDDPGRFCHAKYHFADVAVQHGEYQFGYVGTNDHDVVHAVNAAILQLEGKPAPAPFSFRDNKEALLLLAHFVGDMHQPLHIGAVYLDPKTGHRIDPDATPGDHKKNATQGGNVLMDGASANLHSKWDGILGSYRTNTSQALLAKAAATPATGGDLHLWPALWASDTLLVSQDAFTGMTFGAQKKYTVRGRTVMAWPVAGKPAGYATEVLRPDPDERLAKAGKRLADLLNAVWPD